jgi:hypothetical protein
VSTLNQLTYATVGEGEGGYNEDHEYFGAQASI